MVTYLTVEDGVVGRGGWGVRRSKWGRGGRCSKTRRGGEVPKVVLHSRVDLKDLFRSILGILFGRESFAALYKTNLSQLLSIFQKHGGRTSVLHQFVNLQSIPSRPSVSVHLMY